MRKLDQHLGFLPALAHHGSSIAQLQVISLIDCDHGPSPDLISQMDSFEKKKKMNKRRKHHFWVAFYWRGIPFDILTWNPLWFFSELIELLFFVEGIWLSWPQSLIPISESRASYLCDPIRNMLTDLPERPSLFLSLSRLPFFCLTYWLFAVLQSYAYSVYLQTAYVCPYVSQIARDFTWVNF